MKLATVAVYYDPNQARIAINFLESEGIRAVLENENISHNALLLGQAVGNVRLAVEERDVERARKILGDDTTWEESSLDELALQAQPEAEAKPLFRFFYPDTSEVVSEQSHLETIEDQSTDRDNATHDKEPNAREVLVDRAFRGSILFLVLIPFLPSFILLLPVALLITVLLFQILLSEEPLDPTYQRKLVGALILHIPVLLLALFIARNLFQAMITFS